MPLRGMGNCVLVPAVPLRCTAGYSHIAAPRQQSVDEFPEDERRFRPTARICENLRNLRMNARLLVFSPPR
jgi:hypothetical protein